MYLIVNDYEFVLFVAIIIVLYVSAVTSEQSSLLIDL